MFSLADGIVVAFTSLGLDTTDKVKKRNILNMVCFYVISRRIGNSTIIRAVAVYLFCVVWDKRRLSGNRFHVDHFNSNPGSILKTSLLTWDQEGSNSRAPFGCQPDCSST